MKIGQDEGMQTRPSMKDRVRALREEAILDAAEELIVSKGFAAMTLDDITEAVGISKPTLYLHYRSKEDIIQKITTRCIRSALDFVTSLDTARPAADRLHDFIAWAVDMRFGDDSLLFQDLSLHILPTNDVDSEHYQLEHKLIQAVQDLFTSAQQEGGIRDDVPAVMLGAMLLGFIKTCRVDEILSAGKLNHKEISAGWLKILRKP
jgi:AcrR family transcriptional regulator